MKRALRIVGIVAGTLVLAFAALVSHFAILGGDDVRAQAARMQQERERAVAAVPSGDTHAFDELPYGELQLVATHNSYNRAPTWLQTAVIRLVEPGEADALQYDHTTLTEQLDAGIRSFELDARWDGERFWSVHVPLVGNRATAPDLALGFEEIALWSQRHPDHLPISIMVEVKHDYTFLDPHLKDFDAEAADALDALATARLGGRLFSPGDLDGGAWPTVGELRDRVLLYFGDNEGVRELYLDGHPGLAGRALFTSSKTGAADARFAIIDDPSDPLVATALANGVIVRTRADADLETGAGRRDAALASGAQIVSTDFPPSEPQQGTGYSVAFPNGSLVRAVP
ncbi:MAG: Ca2+-dependent phosphoinositide-specific phospholipase C [Protaetiibacter sp.]